MNKFTFQSKLEMRNYYNVHKWLAYHYGKANACENPDCDKKVQKYTWALKRERRYEKDRAAFLQLCRRCHARYDFTEETKQKLSALYKGRIISPKAYAAASKKLKGVPRTPEVRAKISRGLTGKSNTAAWKVVSQFDASGKLLATYASVREAGEKTRINPEFISRCASGRSRTSKGYVWKYPLAAIRTTIEGKETDGL